MPVILSCKNEIEACFKHWLSHQENGDIAFAFSQVLNACDNSLQLAVWLEELSDLSDSDLDSMAHLPENALANQLSKPQKRICWKEVEANPSDAMEQHTDVTLPWSIHLTTQRWHQMYHRSMISSGILILTQSSRWTKWDLQTAGHPLHMVLQVMGPSQHYTLVAYQPASTSQTPWGLMSFP